MSIKIKVGVIFGGKSVEHEISVISALQAVASFDKEKYDVLPIYLTKDQKFYAGELIGSIENYKNIPALLEKSIRVTLSGENGKVNVIRQKKGMFENAVYDTLDVVFPIVHGTNVEDGTIQGFIKTLGCPYVGCDVISSALGMDKYASKMLLAACGIPVLPCVTFSAGEYITHKDEYISKIESECRYPVIVKPVNLGSSVGIKKAADKDALLSALEYAFEFSKRVLVESAVENLRELNCSVLGDADEAVSSVCEEPIGSDEILSYSDKYLSGGGKKSGGAKSRGMADTKRIIPANIPEELEKKVRDIAVLTFRTLGCSGVSRIDFLNDKLSGELYVNEINTIPGSLSFYLWEASGKSYRELLDELVSLAFKRERDEESINYSFDTNVLAGMKNFGGTKK